MQLKTIKTSLTAAVILYLSFFSNAYAEEYRIGAVSLARLLNESPQAKQVATELEKEFGPRERELIEEQKKLKELQDRLQKDAAIMSESERGRLERDIITTQRDSKRNQDEYREDLTFRRNEELANIQQKMVQAINAVARAENFDLVLTDSAAVYVSTKVDMTQLVIDYIKSQPAN
jgi:outer membrane protein